jgi:L-aspartate oxidase
MRAGAAVADIEFVQFHPTALHHPVMPRPLLSEALRGEGAVLRDEHGIAFMVGEHALGDLAPRDVVSRAITRRLLDRGLDHLWLDATAIDGFSSRFPTIWNACRAAGLDPTLEWLPVAPAAHYLCGGVTTDLDGATTIPGLWACGEVACSGVHGANRLASNSLLDGLVFGPRIVDAIERGKSGPEETGVLRGLLGLPLFPTVANGGAIGDVLTLEALQQVMTVDAGVLRDADRLEHAARTLVGPVGRDDIAGWELGNVATVARALVSAALARRESRGTHTRLDHPDSSTALLGRFVHTGSFAPELVMLPAEVPA